MNKRVQYYFNQDRAVDLSLEIIQLLYSGEQVTLDMSGVTDVDRFKAMMFALTKVFRVDGKNGLRNWLKIKNQPGWHETALSTVLHDIQVQAHRYDFLNPLADEAVRSQNLLQLNILFNTLGVKSSEVTLRLN